jgi:hypothetical protein
MSAENELLARGIALLELKRSRGWALLEAELNERMSDSMERLVSLMDKRPEALTSKAAYRHAMRHRALAEVIAWVDEEIAAAEQLRRTIPN